MPKIQIAQEHDADEVLSTDSFGLMVGMLLDQQYPMEMAFQGPLKIKERFGTLDPAKIAAADPDKFADLCAQTPAIHHYPNMMAGRIQKLAQTIVDDYDGDAASIWTPTPSAKTLLARLNKLPGFGQMKARIFAALLGKQLDVRPDGWRAAIGPYADKGSHRSVADVVDEDSLQKVRDFKKAEKQRKKQQ